VVSRSRRPRPDLVVLVVLEEHETAREASVFALAAEN
jgi:hypothetical protein